MCARASRPIMPIYGANDWDYSYGQSTAETILRDTEFIVEVSPSGGVRPFSVIDGGWATVRQPGRTWANWRMEITQRTARPGIWIRPLEAPRDALPRCCCRARDLGRRRTGLANLPTIPPYLKQRRKSAPRCREAAGWGYEMVKHDFSTYDLLGQWGFEMGPQPTLPGWSLHDRSRTNAEVITGLYAMLRQEAGERVLLDGCNTVGHLGQGIFDLQRTG